MKAWPVWTGGGIGAFVGAILTFPFAVYVFSAGRVVLSSIIVGGSVSLAGVAIGGSFGAAVVYAVSADRRNGGYRCRDGET